MRFEINIPDSTRPELQAMFLTLTRRLSERPELVEEIDMHDDEDAAIQRMFTPERLAHIAKAEAEIEAGDFYTSEQVDDHLRAKHEAWLQEHRR